MNTLKLLGIAVVSAGFAFSAPVSQGMPRATPVEMTGANNVEKVYYKNKKKYKRYGHRRSGHWNGYRYGYRNGYRHHRHRYYYPYYSEPYPYYGYYPYGYYPYYARPWFGPGIGLYFRF